MSRQVATLAATLSAICKTIPIKKVVWVGRKPEVIKLGVDLHARQVTECRQLDGSTPKPAQKWIGCPGAVGQLGALSAWQPPSDERGDGAHCCARTATFGGALPRAADAQSAPSRGTRSGPGFDPGNPGPRGVVAPRSLARV